MALVHSPSPSIDIIHTSININDMCYIDTIGDYHGGHIGLGIGLVLLAICTGTLVTFLLLSMIMKHDNHSINILVLRIYMINSSIGSAKMMVQCLINSNTLLLHKYAPYPSVCLLWTVLRLFMVNDNHDGVPTIDDSIINLLYLHVSITNQYRAL
jgi:hypothetical protein